MHGIGGYESDIHALAIKVRKIEVKACLIVSKLEPILIVSKLDRELKNTNIVVGINHFTQTASSNHFTVG